MFFGRNIGGTMQVKLVPTLVPKWAKLAWAARFTEGAHVLRVLHGPMVEVGENWIAEAVWAGDFAAGDFDRTDLVFGTGVRLRDDNFVFVSSGTVFDRLLYCQHNGSWFFSNSLPALLATAGLSLRDDYLDYSRDARSITRGLENRVRTIPTCSDDIFSVFYNNLVFDGRHVQEQPKPDTAPHFRCYQEYYDFLVATARALGENAAAIDRKQHVLPLSSISSGYDSCATATISRYSGCQDAVTIKQSTSFWRGSDSGAHVAKTLGMACREYRRTAKSYPSEEAIWAAEGRPGIINWTQFDYPEPLCLFFTGCHGEKLWDRVDHDHPDPFVRRDPSSLGFCEFRLLKGVFQCPMPFWGVRRSQELRAITASDEMRPWYMNRDHDKPIARRIVEEAGVPRQAFGGLNKNTSLETAFLWPYSTKAQTSLQRYLRPRGYAAPSNRLASALRGFSKFSSLAYRNTLKRAGIRTWWRPWRRFKARDLLFQWANGELKQRYMVGLASLHDEADKAASLAGTGEHTIE